MISPVEIHEDLATVLAAIDDGFVAVDSEWRCTYVNNKAASLAGHKWHDMIGRTVWDLFPQVIGSEGYKLLHQAMEQRVPVHFEHLFPGCDRWFEHRAYPTNHGMAIFTVDVTNRKEDAARLLAAQERRLLAAQERLTATCDNAPVGIAETDADGRYIRVNRKWCQITGYSQEELLQRRFSDITYPEDIDKDTRFYRELIGARLQTYDLQKRYTHKNGTLLWAQVQRTLVQRPDGSLYCIAIAQDITARKKAEEELKNAQEQLRKHSLELESKVAERTAELEKSNKAMESFCYTIAHDLRAPVRAMQGLTLALMEDYGRQLDSTGEEFTRRINKACGRMDCMIQDLLAFGELTHAKLPDEEINLEVAVGGVLDKLAPHIRSSHATVEVAGPLLNVRGNAIVLNQVLTNLLSNALTFVAPGVSPRVKIWTERKDSLVTISVQDNGIGIAPQYHEKIFELFQTLHPMGEYPGTGIGLALVRQGVERLGGRVGVDSKEGEGSRFWVELKAGKAIGEDIQKH